MSLQFCDAFFHVSANPKFSKCKKPGNRPVFTDLYPVLIYITNICILEKTVRISLKLITAARSYFST